MQELRDSLDKQKIQAAQNAKIVERFKPSEMTDKIREMMTKELENEKKLKMLKLVKVDVSSPEAIQQIKGSCAVIQANCERSGQTVRVLCTLLYNILQLYEKKTVNRPVCALCQIHNPQEKNHYHVSITSFIQGTFHSLNARSN